jgi:hypothetical protein
LPGREGAATEQVLLERGEERFRDSVISAEARSTLSRLFDRSSRPRRSPRQLAPELAEAICDYRRKTGWGPWLVAGATGFAHSTV